MSFEADSYADVFRTVVRQARKAHRCDGCRAAIRPGDRYADVFMVAEREPYTYKRCGRCEATYRHLTKLADPEGLCVAQDLSCGLDYQEEWGEPPPEDVQRLPFLTDDEASALLTETPA